MNPNLFRSVEFYQRRYHNYATVLIIPLSLLFTFILIFSLVATKEITPKFQVEVSHPKEIHLATCSPSIF
ncbi:BlpC ABC transporter [Streptococcus pneumoniae]|nr:BlpC ABC transporter [Streptococcus pneumoniae]